MYKYFPHTSDDVKQMLQAIGEKGIDNLFDEIPAEVRMTKEYNLPDAMSEIEIREYFEDLGKKNQILKVFAGTGVYNHYTPAVIPALLSRQEFLTAYTPYQPEISQGTLQYIFEFQSMISDLTGMYCTNASMYDGTTAVAEAAMMAVASAKKRNTILISQTVNPRVRRVVKTYAHFKGINVNEIPAVNGVTDTNSMNEMLDAGDVAGVVVAQPNYYGITEDFSGYADAIHNAKALMIMQTDPSTLAVLRTPDEWGADIAVGDAQSLGIPMSYGGPYVGFISTTKALMRKLPGRIVGATTDVDGKRAFVLTLQAREQHIRRQKATSNICSNQSLMALFVTMYMAIMGNDGMAEINRQSYEGAHYLYRKLIESGKFEDTYKQPFYKEFTVTPKFDYAAVMPRIIEKGFLPGVVDNGNVIFAVTEQCSRKDIDQLVSLF